LQRDGAQAFVKSWNELLSRIAVKGRELTDEDGNARLLRSSPPISNHNKLDGAQ